eukprot:5098266-Pleurochrysis_carterae.AAC.2
MPPAASLRSVACVAAYSVPRGRAPHLLSLCGQSARSLTCCRAGVRNACRRRNGASSKASRNGFVCDHAHYLNDDLFHCRIKHVTRNIECLLRATDFITVREARMVK